LLKDPAWRRGYRRLADFGLSFDLLVWPWQLTEAARLVAEVPDVPVMVEYMGCPVDRSTGKLLPNSAKPSGATRSPAPPPAPIGSAAEHCLRAIAFRHWRRNATTVPPDSLGWAVRASSRSRPHA
jgi:hypothetical protein